MSRQRKEAPQPDWIKDGALAWYTPIMGRSERRYACVIRGEPFQLGDGSWVVHLRDMSEEYRREIRDSEFVHAALCNGAVFQREGALAAKETP